MLTYNIQVNIASISKPGNDTQLMQQVFTINEINYSATGVSFMTNQQYCSVVVAHTNYHALSY